MLYNFDLLKKYQKLQIFFSQKSDESMKLTSDPNISKNISQNRKAYFLKNNIDPANVISAEIVHGNKIEIVDSKKGEKVIRDADGLITPNKDVYLSITSADCLPIFLFDPKKEIAGIVHAGWRSLAENILFNAIEKIKELGGAPENILVGIGPAICQNHYEVGPEVAEKFENFPEAIRRENKKTYLDLKKIAQLQLLDLRLKKENIEISPECTYELSEKYFSARRDKKKDQPKADRPRAEVEAMIAVIRLSR